MSARALALAPLLLGCTNPPPHDHQPPVSVSASVPVSVPVPGPASVSASVSVSVSADHLTPTTKTLASAHLDRLVRGPGGEGIFSATISGAGVPADAKIELRIASIDAPVVHKRRLAFHRLAAALGAHVVAASVERALTLRELASLLASDRAALDVVSKSAAVRNDGTVATLWLALAPDAHGGPWSRPEGAPLDPYAGGEPRLWSRWIESPEREAQEVPALTRDWVEMIALDYLGATSHRRSVFVVREGQKATGLVLQDNVNAFSPARARTASSSLLKRLTLVARFPRGLRDGLVALTPARQKALFAPAGFDTWLLPPRALIELEERRAALLSLIEAKIAGRDEKSVLLE